MANSGILWIDFLFDVSVRALYSCAKILGITYEEINVWIFCIGWPLTILIAAIWIVRLRRSLARSTHNQHSQQKKV